MEDGGKGFVNGIMTATWIAGQIRISKQEKL